MLVFSSKVQWAERNLFTQWHNYGQALKIKYYESNFCFSIWCICCNSNYYPHLDSNYRIYRSRFWGGVLTLFLPFLGELYWMFKMFGENDTYAYIALTQLILAIPFSMFGPGDR